MMVTMLRVREEGSQAALPRKRSRPNRSRTPKGNRPEETTGPRMSGMTSETAVADLSDADLVVRAREGEESCFRCLVHRYQERAFWIAQGKVHNQDDALEIAQEAFVRVHRALHRYDPNQKFYTWFYQIVTNLSIDLLRRRQKRAKVSLDDVAEAEANQNAPSDGLETEELQGRVHKVLELLPDKYAEVIRLKDIEGLGAKEISELTAVTHATVRWRLHQARKLFRGLWVEQYGDYSNAM